MNKKITAAGLILTISVSTSLVTDHIAQTRATAAQQSAAAHSDQQANIGRVLPRTPVTALRTFMSLVAQRIPESACTGLDTHAATQLAIQYGEPDCAAAARRIRSQVDDINDWIEFTFAPGDQKIHADGTATMNGCAIRFPGHLIGKAPARDPGPRIGRLTLRQIGGGGYLITRIEPCPTGPAPTTPSGSSVPTTTRPTPAAPSSPAVPSMLPVYPPSVPAMVARRIADGSTYLCAYFTPAARAQFAQAARAADCETAVTELRTRVTDARRYANPDSGTTTATPAAGGRVTVDGCALTWTILGQPHATPPGPRIGRLTLEHPPGDPNGYLIAGYAPCR